MQVENAIILSAGKGTRMGELGQSLAKPIWPLFGSKLLEIQIAFLKRNFGIKTFFINSHHLYQQLQTFEDQDIHIVYEPTLLDQGGGVLNICKRFDLWEKPLLINNADQFYFFPEVYFKKALEQLTNVDAVLFGLLVKKSEKYNKLSIDDSGKLDSIILNKNVKEESFYTYSGMSLIKCERVNYSDEPISFFNSIADYREKKVTVELVSNAEYYDLGKLDNYFDLCLKIKKKINTEESDKLIDLLKDMEIDFSNKEFTVTSDSISFPEGKLIKEKGKIRSFSLKK